jgi:hypothetical protein
MMGARNSEHPMVNRFRMNAKSSSLMKPESGYPIVQNPGTRGLRTASGIRCSEHGFEGKSSVHKLKSREKLARSVSPSEFLPYSWRRPETFTESMPESLSKRTFAVERLSPDIETAIGVFSILKAEPSRDEL